MIEKILEENVWDTIKKSSLPVILYGMGNGADMVIEQLLKIGVEFSDVFASDDFVRGQIFHGKKVKTYKEICNEYSGFLIVMCFAVRDDETIKNVRQMAKKHTLVAPNVPIINDGIFTREYIIKHDEEFDQAFSLLADDESKANYINILNFKVSGKIEYLFKAQKDKMFVYKDLFKIDENEIFVDLGAYDGDTIKEFVAACDGKYKKIYAFEADEKNYIKLLKNTQALSRIERLNLAAWNQKETLHFERKKGRNSKLSATGSVSVEANSVDNILNNATILKMDIEGSEGKAIQGAQRLISKHRPKLYVCAYHRNSDMFALPLQINKICPDYSFYFYHHQYIPAWESNFYIVEK